MAYGDIEELIEEGNTYDERGRNKFGLTEKQETFCVAYVTLYDFDPIPAVDAAGYCFTDPTPNRKKTLASKLLTSKGVRNRIKSLTEERDNFKVVDKFWVLSRIRELALNAKTEQAKLRALELLGKHLALFEESNAGGDSGDARSAIQKAMAMRAGKKDNSEDPIARATTILQSGGKVTLQ